VMSVSVCLSVLKHISRIQLRSQIFVRVTYGHGLVHLRQHCDRLGPSSAVDDVIITHYRPYEAMTILLR